MLKNILFFASNICCGARNIEKTEDNKNETFTQDSTYHTLKDEEEKLIIWALKYYIDLYYPENEENDLNSKIEKIIENNTSPIGENIDLEIHKEENEKSLDTSTNLSERPRNLDEVKIKNLNSCVDSLPPLNLENLNNLNYDSEKEHYENTEDKIKKIKKRFEMLKNLK